MSKHSKRRFKALTAGAVVLCVGGVLAVGAREYYREPSVCTVKFSNQVDVTVPVADNLFQRSRGLSKKDDIGDGMLFRWDDAAPREFWMKDTAVPLQIAFFDASGRLFAVRAMRPMTEEKHSSGAPAMYALELPMGALLEHGLYAGVVLEEVDCREGNRR